MSNKMAALSSSSTSGAVSDPSSSDFGNVGVHDDQQRPVRRRQPQQHQQQPLFPRLSDLCRSVVVTSLERYPADAFSILDEDEWDSILRLKHERTRPQRGVGGLDGTGRRHPAVTERYLLEVEDSNPHLEQSRAADLLVWKDVVEYRFKKGGLSRPRTLLYPWPVMVRSLNESGRTLTELLRHVVEDEGNSATATVDERTKSGVLRATECIEESPMDLCLLKESGIGKMLKKFLAKSRTVPALAFLDEPYSGMGTKKQPPRTTLESAMQSWITMAESRGVKMNPDSSSGVASVTRTNKSTEDDLSEARTCHLWRELYHKLKAHDEERRNRQGEKMRERRQRLDSVRPKIVKVRHATTKHNKILDRASGPQTAGGANSATTTSGNSKIQQLKMEASVTSTRRRPPPSAVSSTGAASKPRGSFGAAVAFAAVGKTVTGKRKTAPAVTTAKSVALAGGKRMKVPDRNHQTSENMKKRLKMLKKGQTSFRP
jgi:hypothetical protein